MNAKATIVDGKTIAEHWLREVVVQVQALGAPLHLASLHAGNDAGLEAFVKLKQRAARRCGIEFSSYVVEENEEQRATDVLRWLAADNGVHGIFVELPLPEGWDVAELLSLVPASKDVDVITPAGEQRFYENGPGISPPAVGALDRVMRIHDVARSGTAVVVGRGKLVGRPCAHWLTGQGFAVRTIDVDDEQPERVAATADVLVAGAGAPGLVTGEWIKEGSAVFDFGYARQGSAYVGDVEHESVATRAGLMTPVPGGMGPLVIAATLENLLELSMGT
jgi:methylenetetrahydrofolate dehydrogenase (NADP+)/methenyltetrahydrofolate cyclohydrolase